MNRADFLKRMAFAALLTVPGLGLRIPALDASQGSVEAEACRQCHGTGVVAIASPTAVGAVAVSGFIPEGSGFRYYSVPCWECRPDRLIRATGTRSTWKMDEADLRHARRGDPIGSSTIVDIHRQRGTITIDAREGPDRTGAKV